MLNAFKYFLAKCHAISAFQIVIVRERTKHASIFRFNQFFSYSSRKYLSGHIVGFAYFRQLIVNIIGLFLWPWRAPHIVAGGEIAADLTDIT